MKYLPNTLSIARALAGPAIITACVSGQLQLAWWLFAFAALSDLVDGPLARRLGVTSQTGHVLDRLGDASLLLGLQIGLILAGLLPATTLLWPFFTILMAVHIAVQRRRDSRLRNSEFDERLGILGGMAVVVILMFFGLSLAMGAYGAHPWYGLVGLGATVALAIIRHNDLRRLFKPPPPPHDT